MIFRNFDICCVIYTVFVISALKNLKPHLVIVASQVTCQCRPQAVSLQHGPDCDAVMPPTVYPFTDV